MPIARSLKLFNSNLRFAMLLYFILFLLSSCIKSEKPLDEEPTYFVATYDVDQLPVSDAFSNPIDMGPLENNEMDEVSGIAVSRQDASYIWAHNDSGDSNRIFLIRNDGSYAGTFLLQGASNRDWEDIAIGPGPVDDVNYLFVGEIGDNLARYDVKTIYRFPEPELSQANTLVTTHISDVESIDFVFPNNIRMDAETLLVDPWTKDLYIITKRELPVIVYRLPFPQSTTDTLVAEKYGTLPFPYAVAGDISADGKEILVKTYDNVYLWSRQADESIADAFLRAPLRLNYTPEPQGEAIAFPADGSGYYTLSEVRNGVHPRVYFYSRND